MEGSGLREEYQDTVDMMGGNGELTLVQELKEGQYRKVIIFLNLCVC